MKNYEDLTINLYKSECAVFEQLLYILPDVLLPLPFQNYQTESRLKEGKPFTGTQATPQVIRIELCQTGLSQKT